MKRLIAPLTAGFCIALGLGSASATDLTKIERTLLKEPAYQTKDPKYGSLVFGADAKIRVWLVLDGDVMYLDRNGNGDLTEPDKRIAAKYSRHYPDVPRRELAARREFVIDRLPRPSTTPPKDAILSCIPTVKWFDVEQEIFRDDYVPQNEREQVALDYLRKRQVRVALFLDDRRFEQDGYAVFADQPQNAPIIHFDGPMTVVLDEAKFGPLELRRGETSELYVKLMTPGLEATTVVLSEGFPDSGHPVVEIDWPAAGMDEFFPRSTFALTERC